MRVGNNQMCHFAEAEKVDFFCSQDFQANLYTGLVDVSFCACGARLQFQPLTPSDYHCQWQCRLQCAHKTRRDSSHFFTWMIYPTKAKQALQNVTKTIAENSSSANFSGSFAERVNKLQRCVRLAVPPQVKVSQPLSTFRASRQLRKRTTLECTLTNS